MVELSDQETSNTFPGITIKDTLCRDLNTIWNTMAPFSALVNTS